MKFVSKQKEYTIVVRPTEVVLDESRRPRVMRGEHVDFHGGVFRTEDKSLIQYLLQHPSYGQKFTSEIGNDPVKIQKYTMAFDDGAELSGPKIVAGKPPVEMIVGASSTRTSPIKKEVPVEPIWNQIGNQSNEPTSITKKEVEIIIDSKLNDFLKKIEVILGGTSPAEKEATPEPVIRKSIKVFRCPYCGEPFKSGFAVGQHKQSCAAKPQE
jgi:hypothetical protein